MSSSTADRVAIALGLSARSIAQALVDCGWRVLACDLFLDADTRAIAADVERAPGKLADGIDIGCLGSALADFAGRNGAAGCPLLYGSGFEDRPDGLAELAQRFRLVGNTPDAVRAVKDPLFFASMLKELAIPHPDIATFAPVDPAGWLVKRVGGSGGTHVRPSGPIVETCQGTYWQRMLKGRPISLSFVHSEEGFLPLGFGEQWTDPIDSAPYRFGGAVRLPELETDMGLRLLEWAQVAARRFGLRGLNGADFIVDNNEEAWLLEINPRPGATLDLFSRGAGNPMAAHLRAFGLEAKAEAGTRDGASALQVLYAKSRIEVPFNPPWPDWITDRPMAGTRISPGEPLCTVHARGATRDDTMALLRQRAVDARRLFC